MTKWNCIRKISEFGVANNIDAILKLLEWADKPGTQYVTEEEANAFFAMLCRKQDPPG